VIKSLLMLEVAVMDFRVYRLREAVLMILCVLYLVVKLAQQIFEDQVSVCQAMVTVRKVKVATEAKEAKHTDI
jgi:hypothetical protein